MNSIADLKHRRFKSLTFLVPLLLGVGSSLLTLSSFFHALLQSSSKRIYLYSLFFGLVGGSAWFVGKEIAKWNWKTILLLTGGALVAAAVTKMPVLINQPEGILFYGWLIAASALAVFAMLLPGISGSYILMILGPYPLVIENLSRLSHFDFSSLKILLPVGFGIVTGALCFSRMISFALRRYKNNTLTLLLGFMMGASGAIWPFSEMPSFESTTFLSFAAMLCGGLIVLGIESIAVRTSS